MRSLFYLITTTGLYRHCHSVRLGKTSTNVIRQRAETIIEKIVAKEEVLAGLEFDSQEVEIGADYKDNDGPKAYTPPIPYTTFTPAKTQEELDQLSTLIKDMVADSTLHWRARVNAVKFERNLEEVSFV